MKRKDVLGFHPGPYAWWASKVKDGQHLNPDFYMHESSAATEIAIGLRLFLDREKSLVYQQCNARDVKNSKLIGYHVTTLHVPHQYAWQKQQEKQTNKETKQNNNNKKQQINKQNNNNKNKTNK